VAERLAARLRDAGELRSERAGVGVVLPRPADLLRAASVCALVEAFQAAEQAYWRLEDAIVSHDISTRIAAQRAHETADAAKARLLEVNLG